MKKSHCSFINNCVGIRNMKFFVLFLIGASITAIYTCGISAFYVIYQIYYQELFIIRFIEYSWIAGISIPLFCFTIWHFVHNGELIHPFMIPGFIGLIILTIFGGAVFGINGLIQNPMPIPIGIISAFYIPWYFPF